MHVSLWNQIFQDLKSLMTTWKWNHLLAICCQTWQKKWSKKVKSHWILKSMPVLIFCNRYKKKNWPARLLLPHSSLILVKFQPWQRLCEQWCQWWALAGHRAAWPQHQPLLSPHSFTSPFQADRKCCFKHATVVLLDMCSLLWGIPCKQLFAIWISQTPTDS